MIAAPHNDRTCLDAVTEQLATMVRDRDPAIVEIAEAHRDTAELAAWIRTLPQHDDTGDPDELPKVEACEPPQRLDLFSGRPNCLERSCLFVAAAEVIDPGPVRRLATTRTPDGLHTFPTEDGEPVVLDPTQSRNALAASLFRALQPRNGAAAPMVTTPTELVDWIAAIATEPAARFAQGADRVRNGRRAIRALLVGRPLCVADVRDVGFMLALADRESRQWGPVGPRLVATAARAVDELDRQAADAWQARTAGAARNAVELKIGDKRIRPDLDLLASLGRVGGRLGAAAGIEAIKIKLAALGVVPPVLNSIERELNREGLSLGPLAKPPPMLGSLGAMTPEALAGRWLAGKL